VLTFFSPRWLIHNQPALFGSSQFPVRPISRLKPLSRYDQITAMVQLALDVRTATSVPSYSRFYLNEGVQGPIFRTNETSGLGDIVESTAWHTFSQSLCKEVGGREKTKNEKPLDNLTRQDRGARKKPPLTNPRRTFPVPRRQPMGG